MKSVFNTTGEKKVAQAQKTKTLQSQIYTLRSPSNMER